MQEEGIDSQSVIPGFAGVLFRYEPESGFLFWVQHPWSNLKNGSRADIQGSRGYRIVCCGRKQYAAHRIAWLVQTGNWPAAIDHKNGDRSDNRFENLRESDPVSNAQNRRKPRKRNLAGFLGVSIERSLFRACIKVGSKNIYLGVFKTPEEAHHVYVQAKRKWHQSCTL